MCVGTVVEFATKGDLPLAWYDVSIIPPRLNKGVRLDTMTIGNAWPWDCGWLDDSLACLDAV